MTGGFVAAAGEFEGARFAVGQHSFAVHSDVVGLREKPKAAGLVGRGGDFRGRDGFEGFLHRFHQFDRFAAASGSDRVALSTARSNISLQPPPPGSRPHSDLHQANVEFGVRLARGSVQ